MADGWRLAVDGRLQICDEEGVGSAQGLRIGRDCEL